MNSQENIHRAKPAPLKVDLSLLNTDFFRDSKALKARKTFSKTLTFKIFLILSSMLAVTEPVLIGFRPEGFAFVLQIIILAASTLTFFLDIAFTAYYYDKSYDMEKLAPWQIAVAIIQGEVLLDAFCLLFGWCTIFQTPGLAALRCLRVFRLLWYYELFPDVKDVDFNPAHAVFSFRKASQLCLLYMKGVAQEIFTQKSKGGLVVIAMYLYISYLVAVVFWIETKHLVSIQENEQECRQLNTCFITMIRLSFYDGNGFDFMQTLALSDYFGYTMLIFIYMLLSAVVMLNGLIGIFGSAFVGAADSQPAIDHFDSAPAGTHDIFSTKSKAPANHHISQNAPITLGSKYAMVHPGGVYEIEETARITSHNHSELASLIHGMRQEIVSLKETVNRLRQEIARSNAKSNVVSSPSRRRLMHDEGEERGMESLEL